MKHTLKKSLALFLAVLMLVLCAPAAFAANGTDGDIKWTVSGLKLKIEKVIYTGGAMKDYLGSEAPWNKDAHEVTNITISTGVTKIGSNAFNLLSYVNQVTIPDTVTSIGECAFQACASLQSITIPSGVTTIRNNTFRYCDSLQTVTLPLGLTEIGERAFLNCNAQLTINYPGGPDDWNKIKFGKDAFSLQETGDPRARTEEEAVTINYYYGVQGAINAINAIGANDGSAAYLARVAVASVAYGKLIPAEQYSVENADLLVAAKDALSDYEFGACGVNTAYAWNKTTGNLVIGGTGPMYDYAYQSSPFNFSSDVKTVVIANGVTAVGDNMFKKCESLQSVTFPNDGSLKTIGEEAFGDCTALTDVTLPQGLTTIVQNAFEDSGLTSVTIPGTVTQIGECAFAGCSCLTSVTIPKSVTEIMREAFESCMELCTLNYTGGEDDWKRITFGKEVFNGDSVDKPTCYYYGPEGAKNAINDIGEVIYSQDCKDRIDAARAAYDRLSDEEKAQVQPAALNAAIDVYNEMDAQANELAKGGKCGENVSYSFDKTTCTLTVSGTGPMFDYGSNSNSPFHLYGNVIKSVVIEEGVTSIGNRAFDACQNMQSVTIPQGVTSIGGEAFYGCSGLTDVTIPKGVTSIKDLAFYHCAALQSVTIPKSVEEIWEAAFQKCTSLVTVNYTGSRAEWDAIWFDPSENNMFSGTPDNRTVNCDYRMNGVVTLHPGNGEADDTVNALVYEDMPQITLPEKEGAAFLGYFDAPEGGKQYYNADGTSARTLDKAALDLYGHWVNIYPVTFKSWDGKTVLKEQTVAEGSDATPPEIPARDPDETNHYTPGVWSGYTNITAATTLAAPYTAEAHSYGDTGDARFTCGTCGYVNETLKAQAEADDAAAADAVEAKIAAIGNVTYTAESKAKIDEAQAAYDALTDAQKALVENKDALDAAAKEYAELQAESEKPTEPEKPEEPTDPEELSVGNEKLYNVMAAVMELVVFVITVLIPFIISLT